MQADPRILDDPEASSNDRFVVLDHGRVLATGLPRAVVEDTSEIEAYLGKKWLARQNA